MKPITLDLTAEQREAVGDRELVVVETTEACLACGATFSEAEQRAFDPEDNDHCPSCGERGMLTTYYGDPEYRITEHQLGDPQHIFVAIGDRKR